MDDQVRIAAVTAARELLSRYKDAHPAWQDDTTPIDELVSWQGIQVETFHPNDYPQGTYGYLEPGEDLIWLCRNLTESLRRFTLAHELGHAILHRSAAHMQAAPQALGIPELSRDDPCQQPDVQEEIPALNEADLLEEVLGIGMTYDPRSERELTANIFAAELLMPLERVRTLYLDLHTSPNTLAATFSVSNAAMLNRLAGLLSELPTENLRTPTGEAPGQPDPAPPPKHYDEFQQAAIEAAAPALIVAGPGSGKTSTLIGRVEYLITTLYVQPEHILALTFSRKAAQEMQERLQAALQSISSNASIGDAWQAPAALSVPKVSTFHAFCADVLRTYGERVGLRPDFTLIDEIEGYFLLRQLSHQMQLYHYRNLKAPAYYFPDFLKAISRAKDELVPPAQYQRLAQRMLEEARDEEAELAAKKALEVASIYALYEEALHQRKDTDFGGLIMLTVRLLEEFPAVRAEQQQRFQHILVDEFQDINRASGVLLRLLAGEQRRVWVVGDANQAIYSFRGASPANIANFQQDYPGAAVLPLSRNYRSRPDIVQAAETFRWRQLELGAEVKPLGNAPARQSLVAELAQPPSAMPSNAPARLNSPDVYVTLAAAEDSSAEVAGLIADIQRKRAQGCSYADIAVLCRTRARARRITHALAQAGLPVIEKSGMLAQQHIKDVISILLLMTDASGMGILRAARHTEHAFTQDDIEALLLAAKAQHTPLGILLAADEAPGNLSREGRRSLSRLATILRNLFQYSSHIWSLLAQYLFIETTLIRSLLREPTGQQRALLDDYAAFLQLARRYDQQQQARRALQEQQAEERGESPAPPPPIREQVRGFHDYLNVMLSLGQDGGSRQQGAEGEDEENAAVIRVMTVHASKGLEFPIVYLPGLIQRNFPLQRHANPVPVPVGMIAGAGAEQDVHEVGEACLFYVGVTRARDHLVLSYSQRNGKQKARPSPFLESLVSELPAERITRLQWQTTGETRDEEEAVDDFTLSSQPSRSFIETVKPGQLSVSAIEAYQTCPRKYLYSTIYGFSGEESSYQLFWQATQQTLALLQKKLDAAREQGHPAADELLTLAEAEQLYTQQWRELGGHVLPFAAIYERHGHEVARLIREKLLESGDTHWELRQSFTVEVGSKTISVPVDRVEVSAQREMPARFVRARFARRSEKPTMGMREMLYARAYRQQHAARSIELHFHNLSTGETFPITLNARKEQALFDELEQSIAALERNEYPPLPDARTCPSCAFFLICPA